MAGFALGTVYGLQARDLQSQADDICPDAACPSQEAIDLNEDARSKSTIANIMFATGVVAAGGAVVLWLAGAPSSSASTESTAFVQPILSGDRAGVSLYMRF